MFIRTTISAWFLSAILGLALLVPTASASSRAELERESRLALNALLGMRLANTCCR